MLSRSTEGGPKWMNETEWNWSDHCPFRDKDNNLWPRITIKISIWFIYIKTTQAPIDTVWINKNFEKKCASFHQSDGNFSMKALPSYSFSVPLNRFGIWYIVLILI